MEIEAAIPPVSVRFKKLCQNYAIRILQMQDFHLIKIKVPANSPFSFKNENEIKLTDFNNSVQIANWNQNLLYSESESDSELEYYDQRKKKIKRKKLRKCFSQLFRFCSLLKKLYI